MYLRMKVIVQFVPQYEGLFCLYLSMRVMVQFVTLYDGHSLVWYVKNNALFFFFVCFCFVYKQ